MNSGNHTYLLLTDNDGESSKYVDKLRTALDHIKLIDTQTSDEIRNFVIDELIYRLKDIYPSISNEIINIVADEIVATIDNIISEVDNFKNIDDLIKNEKIYSTLAVVTLMITRSRELNTMEISKADIFQVLKIIIKNALKLYSQKI